MSSLVRVEDSFVNRWMSFPFRSSWSRDKNIFDSGNSPVGRYTLFFSWEYLTSLANAEIGALEIGHAVRAVYSFVSLSCREFAIQPSRFVHAPFWRITKIFSHILQSKLSIVFVRNYNAKTLQQIRLYRLDYIVPNQFLYNEWTFYVL